VDALHFDDFARTLRRDRLYFADRAEDLALFDQYPVINQAEISRGDPPRRSRGRKRKGRQSGKSQATAEKGLKSFAEKAADEFSSD
jgi:ribosomal protein L15E